MKSFIVKVCIRAGEFEKNCTKFVKANTSAEAESQALLGECHGELGEDTEWTENGIADVGWQFHYSVNSCIEVSPEHAAILQAYF